MKFSRKTLCILLAMMICLSACPYAMGEADVPPAVQEAPTVEEMPTVEESPVAEEPPVAEELPVVEDPPAVEEPSESIAESSEQPEPETEPMTELETEPVTEPETEPVTEPETEPAPFLYVDEAYVRDGLLVPHSGMEKKIEVSSSVSWTVEAKAEWIVLTAIEGGFELRIGENPGEARASRIELSAQGCETVVIPVTQEAAPAQTPDASAPAEPTAAPDSDIPEPTAASEPADTLLPPQDPEGEGETTQPAEPGDTSAADDAADNQLPNDVPEAEAPDVILLPRDGSIGWKGTVQSDRAGMPVPMLFQEDYRTIVLYYNGEAKSVATSGCGAASLSMVIAYLTGNVEQNPYRLFCSAVEAGRYHGSGLSHDTLCWLADAYGLKTEWIENDAEAILASLEANHPVIAHMGRGIFTQSGHYIVLCGLDADGNVVVNDPNSRLNSTSTFPLETLLEQARTDRSFLVCRSGNEPDPTAPTEPQPTESEETTEPGEFTEPTAPTELPVQPSEEPVQFQTVLLYDVNDSGRVDINDAQWLYAMLVAYENGELSYEDILRYDLDGDGNLTWDDLACLMDALNNPLESARTCEIPLLPEEPQPEAEPEAPTAEEPTEEEHAEEEPAPEAEQLRA